MVRTSICYLAVLQLIAGAVGGRVGVALRAQDGDRVHLKGSLVAGGAECPRFRADDMFYTLEGSLRGFRIGDQVEITGVLVRASHCMQDKTIRIETIVSAERSVVAG